MHLSSLGNEMKQHANIYNAFESNHSFFNDALVVSSLLSLLLICL